MGSIVNREELRRLEKAARDKNKNKLASWIRQFEQYLDSMMKRDYAEVMNTEIVNHYNNILTAVAYTAYFSEESYIDKKNIADFMADLFVSLDMFRIGEYTPQEYADQLKEEGITLDEYDSDLIYKKYLNIFDSDLVKYLKNRPTKIITICGSSKFKDEILKANEDLTMQNYIVLMNGVFQHADNIDMVPEEKIQLDLLHKDKILMSDAIYVVNKDGYIGESTKSEIEFAKEHNKEIIYMEEIKE